MENKLFKKNFLWNMLGSTLNGFNSLFFMIIITRINGVDDAGIFSLSFSLVCLIYIVGSYAGRTYQVTDCNSEYTDSDYIVQRMITCGLMILIAFGYSYISGYNQYKFTLVMLLTVLKVLEAAGDVFYAIVQKRGELYKCGISATIKSILSILVLCVIDKLTNNLILSFVIIDLIWLGILLGYDIPNSLKYVKEKYSLIRVKNLFKSGFYAFAVLFLSVYLANATKYTLDGRVASDLQAIYGIIIMPATLISLCLMYILQPYLNKLSGNYIDNNKKQFSKIVKKIFIEILFIGIIALIGFTFMGIPVLSAVYNVKLNDYLTCLQIIIVGAIFNALVTLLSTVLTTLRNTGVQFIISLFCSIVVLVISPFLVNIWGLFGASIAYTATSMLQFIIYLLVYLNRMSKWK